LALKGKRFETCQQFLEAIEATIAYWNVHKHPFAWGRRCRHQSVRCSQKYPFKVKVLAIWRMHH
jgi:hypothetical protein